MSRFLRRRREDEDDDDDDDDEAGSQEEEEVDNDEEEDDDDDEEEEDDDASSSMSAEVLGPRTVAAPYLELGTLLNELCAVYNGAKANGPAALVVALKDILEKLQNWCSRSMNDHERGVTEKNHVLSLHCGDVVERQVVGMVCELMVAFLDHGNDEGLTSFLYVLEVVKSQEGHNLELKEAELDRLGLEVEQDTVLPGLWRALDASRALLEEKMLQRLLRTLQGTLQTFSLAQATLFDLLRDVWSKFMMNWVMQQERYDMQHPFLGYPGLCPGFSANFKDPKIDWSRIITDLASPELQRAAILFIEAFFFLLDRDVISVTKPNFADIQDAETVGRFLCPALIGVLSHADVDETTRMFALRCVEASPIVFFAHPDRRPHFEAIADVLRASQNPAVVYQGAACIQSICGIASGDADDLVATSNWTQVNFEQIMDSLTVAFAAMRRQIGVSGAWPSECANAAACVERAICSFSFCAAEMHDLQDQLQEWRRKNVDKSLSQLTLAAKSRCNGYSEPALFQLCSMSFSPAQMYEGPNAVVNLPCGRLAAGHALYSRLMWLSHLLLSLLNMSNCCGIWEAEGVNSQQFVALLEVGHELLRLDVSAHLTHAGAVATLCQDQNIVMDRIVNGGHLDGGARVELKEADQYARLGVYATRVWVEYCSLMDVVLGLRKDLPLSSEAFLQLWVQLVDRVEWTDSAKVKQLFEAECASLLCVPTTLGRLVECVTTSASVFNAVVRVCAKALNGAVLPSVMALVVTKLTELLHVTAPPNPFDPLAFSTKDTSMFHINHARLTAMLDRRSAVMLVACRISDLAFARELLLGEGGVLNDLRVIGCMFQSIKAAMASSDKHAMSYCKSYLFEVSNLCHCVCSSIIQCLQTSVALDESARADARVVEWLPHFEVIADVAVDVIDSAAASQVVVDDITSTTESVAELLPYMMRAFGKSMPEFRRIAGKILRARARGLELNESVIEDLRKSQLDDWQSKIEDTIAMVMNKFNL